LPAKASGAGALLLQNPSMGKSKNKGQRLAALCLLGLALFNFPMLALFNRSGTAFGVPLLYAYIFLAWAVLIVLMAVVVESDD
jgi:hypothetical protein